MLTGTDPFGEFTKFCIKFTLFVDMTVNFQLRQKDVDIVKNISTWSVNEINVDSAELNRKRCTL
jgi:hypothetical protein